MKAKELINGMHKKYHEAFSYGGTMFIVDRLDDAWLITEQSFTMNYRHKDLDKAKEEIKKKWDKWIS